MRHDHFVVDIRRNRGDSRLIIELVRRFCSSYFGATVEWLVRPDQAHLLPPDHIFGQGGQFDTSWTARIRDRLILLSQGDNAGGSLWVLSYDNNVLAETQGLGLTNVTVNHKHLGELISAASASRRPQFNGAPLPVDSVEKSTPSNRDPLTLAEACALAKEALQAGQHVSRETALAQKDLRQVMGVKDNRAYKRAGDPASASLVANVVDAGQQEGWLRRFRRVPNKTGTEALYLVEAEVKEASPVTSGLPEPPTAISDTSPAPPPVEASSATGGESKNNSSDSNSLRRKFPNRATAFEAVLKKAQIGSMPDTRELFFDALETLIVPDASGEYPQVPELFAEARRRAEARAAEEGYVAEKNWTTAQRCIQRLMLWAGVLKGAKGFIEDKIGCNSTRVVELAPDFRRVCEGYLTLFIVRELSVISYDDDPYYLGLTLYRRGQQKAVSAEALKTRVDELLTHLADQGLIEMDEDRKIVALVRQGNPRLAAGAAAD